MGVLTLAAFGMAFMTPQAQAQTYAVRMEPVDYERMPQGGFPDGEPAVELKTSSWQASDAPVEVQLPFPFTFYGQTYTSMSVAVWGAVGFGATLPTPGVSTSSPPWGAPYWELDDPATPNNIIAMWMWSLVCAGTLTGSDPLGRVQTQVLGTAPNRRFVLDYPNCRGYAAGGNTPRYKFQLWLKEGSDEIEVRYGHDINDPPTVNANYPRAGVGVRKDSSDFTWGLCTGHCVHEDFPSGYALIYSSGPQIRVTDIEGQEQGFAGIAFPLRYNLSNPGSKPAEGFTVQYWASPVPEITPQSISMGYAEHKWSLDPKQTIEVVAEPRLPIELEEGSYYVIVEADPHHDVDIPSRGGTLGVYGPFELGIRAPNLNAPWIDAPDLVRPGDSVDVRWIARNSGNLLANGIAYRLVLERARFLSPASPTLAEGMVDSLDMGQERLVTTRVQIPADTEPGIYYLGVEVNPNQEIYEHEKRDNYGFSLPVVVSEEDLVIVTESLPQGHIHGHYEVRLVAAGGNGTHVWRLGEGRVLPPGLRLETRESELGELATFLVGQPGAVGRFPLSFVVSSGSLSTEVELELVISAAEYALSIATGSLAEASFGFEYRDQLSAMGGQPPYTWEVMRADALPHGLFLRSDGVLSGRPQEDGLFEIPVRVSDRAGRQATKDFLLDVAPPSTLTCVTQELPELTIDGFFQHQLLAAGGNKRADGTYVWTHQSLLRLAQELGEVSGPVRQDFGLTLEPNGTIHGEPKLFGTFLWTVQVSDDTPGAQGVNCPILVRVPHDRGLTVVTQQLPAAIAGRSYRAQLEASGGSDELTWSEYGSNRILDELKLEFDATGNLVGTPSLDALQGEAEKEFSITVRAVDGKGRIGVGVVNLVLKEAPQAAKAPAKDEGGCQAGSGGPVGGLILLAGLALLRRRRS